MRMEFVYLSMRGGSMVQTRIEDDELYDLRIK